MLPPGLQQRSAFWSSAGLLLVERAARPLVAGSACGLLEAKGLVLLGLLQGGGALPLPSLLNRP